MCRRAVRVKPQLKSHKRFANAFMTYCTLVDNAKLYSTNALEGPPKVKSIYTPCHILLYRTIYIYIYHISYIYLIRLLTKLLIFLPLFVEADRMERQR